MPFDYIPESDRGQIEFSCPEIEPAESAWVTRTEPKQRFRVFLAFDHKTMVVDVKSAFLAERAEVEPSV